MNTKNKIILGVVIGGIAIYTILRMRSLNVNRTSTASIEEGSGVQCPANEIPCPSGLNCYNPNLNYLVSPCSIIV